MPRKYRSKILTAILFCGFLVLGIKIVPDLIPENNLGYPELLLNGQFEMESSGLAPHWKLIMWDGGQGESSSVGGQVGMGQKITATNLSGEAGVYFHQPFAIQKGHVYRFSLWLRSNAELIVRVQLRKDSPYYDNGANRTIIVGTHWQQVMIEGGLSQDVQGSVGILLMAAGSVEIDNASLLDITDEIVNGYSPQQEISSELFGIHFNKPGVLSGEDYLPDIGYGRIRLWDNLITWSDIEPLKGEWDFFRFDVIMNHLAKNPAEFVYTLGMTPEWARANPEQRGSAPANLDDWRSYIRMVATRYKGQIQYYEIWNEANYVGFSTINPQEFVTLTRIARDELLAIDPSIKILSPNIDALGLGFLDRFLFYGGGQYIDVISYHIYPDAYYPENSLGVHIGVMNIRNSYGLQQLPVWNTEGAPRYSAYASEKVDRAATARTYLYQWSIGVESFFWYTWDLFTWGDDLHVRLSTDDYLNTRPAGEAFKQLTGWLVGKQVLSKSVQNGIWHIVLKNQDNQLEHILWHYDDNFVFTIPETWSNPLVHSLVGEVQAIQPATNLLIDIEPILITTSNTSVPQN